MNMTNILHVFSIYRCIEIHWREKFCARLPRARFRFFSIVPKMVQKGAPFRYIDGDIFENAKLYEQVHSMTKTRQWFPRLQTIKYLWEKNWHHRYTFGLGAKHLNVRLTYQIATFLRGGPQGHPRGPPGGPLLIYWWWDKHSNALPPIQKCNDDVKFFLKDTLWFVVLETTNGF